jgi:hypothetical protein
MTRRFTGIRLLLVFVAINLLMFLTLVSSMTGAHPWIAQVLPGQFETGKNASGYWVFFALVLLVDAVTVFIAGLAMMLPAMMDGAPLNERRLTRLLVDRAGMNEEAKEAIFVGLREDAVNAQVQLIVGRAILLAGAIFLAVAFFAVIFTFARAMPDGQMFVGRLVVPVTHDVGAGDKLIVVTGAATTWTPIQNKAVRARQMLEYTTDQVLAAAALNAPAIYGVQFSPVLNNPHLPLFTHFIFVFRTLLGFTLVLFIISFLRHSQRPVRHKKTIASVEAKLDEVKKK